MSEHGIEAAGRSNLVEGVQAAQEDDQKREYRIVSFSLKKKNNTNFSTTWKEGDDGIMEINNKTEERFRFRNGNNDIVSIEKEKENKLWTTRRKKDL